MGLDKTLRLHERWLAGCSDGERADLSTVYLPGANLNAVNLSRACLFAAYLCNADLFAADLHDADLTEADLRRANLRAADLRRADLRGADLYGSDLVEADLRGANLKRTNLNQAKLHRTIGVIYAGTRDGWTTFGWLWAGELRIRAGCRDFSVSEARKYWAGKFDRREILAAVDYIEACAIARGWVEEHKE